MKIVPRRQMDLISGLPDNLIETILMKLPLLEAARTCILSRRWRYSWVKLPRLNLDVAFWKQSLKNESQGRAAKFENILFRILLLHQGPITSITFRMPKLEKPLEIDTLINFIVRNGIQTCSLDMFPRGHYKLNSSLFTCPTLTHLDLRCCRVIFPSYFGGFINLITIKLLDVTISAQALGSLVSSCPSLAILELKISIDISSLEIKAPKLIYFNYHHSYSSHSLLPTNYGPGKGILKLLGGSPHLRYLHMDDRCLKTLTAGGFAKRLPTGILHHLKNLNLVGICLEDVDQFSSVICLIRMSPKLQKLEVYLTSNNNMWNLNEEEDYPDLTLNHLVEINMISVAGGKLELKLIRILLARSPSLRKMNIGLATSKIADKGLKIVKEMFMFPRAAPNVEVHID